MSNEGPPERLKLALGRLGEIRRAMLDDQTIFAPSFEIVGHHFLNKHWSENTFSVPFQELRARFIAEGHGQDLPQEKDEFFSELCREYLDLNRLPSEALLNTYETASKHLGRIKSNIRELSEAMAALSRKDKKTDHDIQAIRLYRYYRSMNRRARQEIVDFLADTSTMRAHVLGGSTRHLLGFMNTFSFLWDRQPYRYASFPYVYDIRNFSDLASKFGNLTLNEFRDWNRLYESSGAPQYFYGGSATSPFQEGALDDQKVDPKVDPTELNCFLDLTQEYLTRHAILESIDKLINAHHRLCSRGEILRQSLKAYQETGFSVFCSVIPLQIEGLFHDICIDAGVDEKKLTRPTLLPKVQQVGQSMFFPDLAYFAYRFPLIRNRVAHGIIMHADPRHLAPILLLDLYRVCDLITSDELPVNRAVKIIRALASTPTNMTSVMQGAMLDYVVSEEKQKQWEVPAFYALESVRNGTRAMCAEDAFWTCLRWYARRTEPVIRTGLIKLLVSFKKKGETQAIDVLKEMGTTKIPEKGKLDLAEFFEKSDALRHLLDGEPS
jgi:hypothetical protein